MNRAPFRPLTTASASLALVGTLFSLPASTQSSAAVQAPASPQPLGAVFVIAMENTNWQQVANQFSGSQQQIFQNPAGPFINSLVNGTATLTIGGVPTNIGPQTAYTTAYHNVLSTPTGNNPSIHPSEPNYLWAEAGSNFGVLNDNQPYGNGGTNQNTTNHLTTLLTNAGRTWKSYQEDVDLLPGAGGINTPGANSLTSTVAPSNQWTVPLTNFSGTSAAYTNPYNLAHQYDYAAKHNPMVFFTDTNGGNNNTATNPLASHYAPLQQLAADLANNTVADYNWITPNQFNDMHTALAGSFTYNGVTYLNNGTQSGAEKVAQGDNFLKQILPVIMASQAYKNNGVIILWWDESEPDGQGNQNDFNHIIPEIVISPVVHPNVGGLPYASTVNYTHTADLRTMQEVFGVASAWLLDARDDVNGPDLADLFAPGALAGPFTLTRGGFVRDRRTQRFVQQVTVQNTSAATVPGPLFMVLDNLSANASLATASGISSSAPVGRPYVSLPVPVAGLAPGASASVVLEFTDPTNAAIGYSVRLGNAIP
jgi:hypothetical protein